MTTKGRAYPTRVPCRFGGKSGQVVLDQIRTVDQARLVKKLGRIDDRTAQRVLDVLQEMFAR
jgi:mRNA interferase MazF